MFVRGEKTKGSATERIRRDVEKEKEVNSSSPRISICTVKYFTPHSVVAVHTFVSAQNEKGEK